MNKQNTILFFILFYLFFLALDAQAQEWNFEKDSILITISNKTIGSSNCVNLYASMNVTCSFQKVIQTLKDYDNYQSWYYSCVESRELTKQKGNIQYFYTMSQIPFLLNYRDAVFKAEYFDSPKKYSIKISSLPEYMPEIEDISRMQFAEGKWEIYELSTKNISIKYQFIIDPGFTVPLFLVHQKLAKTPYNTFSNLKKESTKHRKLMIFIGNGSLLSKAIKFTISKKLNIDYVFTQTVSIERLCDKYQIPHKKTSVNSELEIF